MRAYHAEFRCSDGCEGAWPLAEVIYRCPKCAALLEVVHDTSAWRLDAPDDWKARFERRCGAGLPDGSGVWGRRELVHPLIDASNIVSLHEGMTPLLPGRGYAAELGLDALWIKQCGTSHTGSFKDLGMTVLVSNVKDMIAHGRGIRALACASTGDTSAALAAYGAAAGIPVVVLLPANKVSAAQLVQPLAHGALVCSLDTDFDGCMRVVQALTEDASIYLANSMNSIRVEGQKTIAYEIAQQLNWRAPDWVFVPGGNLGNVSAIVKGFEDLRTLGICDTLPRVVCCQAQRANPLYLAYERAMKAGRELDVSDYEAVVAAPTLASAIQIGAPVSLPKAIQALRASKGRVMQASEAELADAAARADRHGFFCCPHTGVALACLEKLRATHAIEPKETVVVISTAHGLKFTEFKSRYHRNDLERPSRWANPPVELAGTEPQEVVANLHRLLDRRT